MSDATVEIAEFLGKLCGIIVKDVEGLSGRAAPLAARLSEAFRRGWRAARAEPPKSEPAPSPSKSAVESA